MGAFDRGRTPPTAPAQSGARDSSAVVECSFLVPFPSLGLVCRYQAGRVADPASEARDAAMVRAVSTLGEKVSTARHRVAANVKAALKAKTKAVNPEIQDGLHLDQVYKWARGEVELTDGPLDAVLRLDDEQRTKRTQEVFLKQGCRNREPPQTKEDAALAELCVKLKDEMTAMKGAISRFGYSYRHFLVRSLFGALERHGLRGPYGTDSAEDSFVRVWNTLEGIRKGGFASCPKNMTHELLGDIVSDVKDYTAIIQAAANAGQDHVPDVPAEWFYTSRELCRASPTTTGPAGASTSSQPPLAPAGPVVAAAPAPSAVDNATSASSSTAMDVVPSPPPLPPHTAAADLPADLPSTASTGGVECFSSQEGAELVKKFASRISEILKRSKASVPSVLVFDSRHAENIVNALRGAGVAVNNVGVVRVVDPASTLPPLFQDDTKVWAVTGTGIKLPVSKPKAAPKARGAATASQAGDGDGEDVDGSDEVTSRAKAVRGFQELVAALDSLQHTSVYQGVDIVSGRRTARTYAYKYSYGARTLTLAQALRDEVVDGRGSAALRGSQSLYTLVSTLLKDFAWHCDRGRSRLGPFADMLFQDAELLDILLDSSVPNDCLGHVLNALEIAAFNGGVEISPRLADTDLGRLLSSRLQGLLGVSSAFDGAERSATGSVLQRLGWKRPKEDDSRQQQAPAEEAVNRVKFKAESREAVRESWHTSMDLALRAERIVPVLLKFVREMLQYKHDATTAQAEAASLIVLHEALTRAVGTDQPTKSDPAWRTLDNLRKRAEEAQRQFPLERKKNAKRSDPFNVRVAATCAWKALAEKELWGLFGKNEKEAGPVRDAYLVAIFSKACTSKLHLRRWAHAADLIRRINTAAGNAKPCGGAEAPTGVSFIDRVTSALSSFVKYGGSSDLARKAAFRAVRGIRKTLKISDAELAATGCDEDDDEVVVDDSLPTSTNFTSDQRQWNRADGVLPVSTEPAAQHGAKRSRTASASTAAAAQTKARAPPTRVPIISFKPLARGYMMYNSTFVNEVLAWALQNLECLPDLPTDFTNFLAFEEGAKDTQQQAQQRQQVMEYLFLKSNDATLPLRPVANLVSATKSASGTFLCPHIITNGNTLSLGITHYRRVVVATTQPREDAELGYFQLRHWLCKYASKWDSARTFPQDVFLKKFKPPFNRSTDKARGEDAGGGVYVVDTPFVTASGNLVPWRPGTVFSSASLAASGRRGGLSTNLEYVVVGADPGLVTVAAFAVCDRPALSHFFAAYKSLYKAGREFVKSAAGTTSSMWRNAFNVHKSGLAPLQELEKDARFATVPAGGNDCWDDRLKRLEAVLKMRGTMFPLVAGARARCNQLHDDAARDAGLHNLAKAVTDMARETHGRDTPVLVFFGDMNCAGAVGGTYRCKLLRDALSNIPNVYVVVTHEAYTTKRCAACASPAGEQANPKHRETDTPCRGLSVCNICKAPKSRDLASSAAIAMVGSHILANNGERPGWATAADSEEAKRHLGETLDALRKLDRFKEEQGGTRTAVADMLAKLYEWGRRELNRDPLRRMVWVGCSAANQYLAGEHPGWVSLCEVARAKAEPAVPVHRSHGELRARARRKKRRAEERARREDRAVAAPTPSSGDVEMVERDSALDQLHDAGQGNTGRGRVAGPGIPHTDEGALNQDGGGKVGGGVVHARAAVASTAVITVNERALCHRGRPNKQRRAALKRKKSLQQQAVEGGEASQLTASAPPSRRWQSRSEHCAWVLAFLNGKLVLEKRAHAPRRSASLAGAAASSTPCESPSHLAQVSSSSSYSSVEDSPNLGASLGSLFVAAGTAATTMAVGVLSEGANNNNKQAGDSPICVDSVLYGPFSNGGSCTLPPLPHNFSPNGKIIHPNIQK